jgi:hypothetical protein
MNTADYLYVSSHRRYAFLIVRSRELSFYTINGMSHIHTHITRIYLTRSQTETNKATKPFKQQQRQVNGRTAR